MDKLEGNGNTKNQRVNRLSVTDIAAVVVIIGLLLGALLMWIQWTGG